MLFRSIREGKLRAFATMSERRNAMLPDVPTVAEASVPGCEAELWTAIVVPSRVPGEIVHRLKQVLAAVVNSPDILHALTVQGVDPEPGPAETVTERIKADIAKWREVAANAKIVGSQ